MAVLAVWLAVDTRRRRRYIRSTSTQISCHIHSQHELGIEATLWENEPREKADADLDLLQMVRPVNGPSRWMDNAMESEAGRPRIVVLACLGCILFPAAVMALVLTYEQNADEPGPWPYSAVDSLFYADLCYTILLIGLMRGWRRVAALVSIPLLLLTAGMVILARMWFTNNYL